MTKADFKLGRKRGQVYRLHGKPRRWRRLTARSVGIFEKWLRGNPHLFRAVKGRAVALKVDAFGRKAGTRLPGWLADVLQSSPLDEADEIRAWHASHRLACKIAEVRAGLHPPTYQARDWTPRTIEARRPLFIAVWAKKNKVTGELDLHASKPCSRGALLSDFILAPPATESDIFCITYRPIPKRMPSAKFRASVAMGIAGRDREPLMAAVMDLWGEFFNI